MRLNKCARLLARLGDVRCRYNAVAQHGLRSHRCPHNFSGRRRMRLNCLSNDAVNFVAAPPAANAHSGHDNSLHEIRPGPHCRAL